MGEAEHVPRLGQNHLARVLKAFAQLAGGLFADELTLTHKGLVEATAGSVDRRTTVLSLTTAGIDAAKTVRQIEHDLYAGLGFIVGEDRSTRHCPCYAPSWHGYLPVRRCNGGSPIGFPRTQ